MTYWAYRRNTSQANAAIFYFAYDLNNQVWKLDAAFANQTPVTIGDYTISDLGSSNGYKLLTDSNGTAYSVYRDNAGSSWSPTTQWLYAQSVTANTNYALPFSHNNNYSSSDRLSVLAFKKS